MTKCLLKNELTINEGAESHDFGVKDKVKVPRAVGARVAFRTVTYEAGTRTVVASWDSSKTWDGYDMRIEPGTYYCWLGQATRGGVTFGAGQSWNHCKTEAERFAAVAKYLKAAKARAVKAFAPKATSENS